MDLPHYPLPGTYQEWNQKSYIFACYFPLHWGIKVLPNPGECQTRAVRQGLFIFLSTLATNTFIECFSD